MFYQAHHTLLKVFQGLATPSTISFIFSHSSQLSLQPNHFIRLAVAIFPYASSSPANTHSLPVIPTSLTFSLPYSSDRFVFQKLAQTLSPLRSHLGILQAGSIIPSSVIPQHLYTHALQRLPHCLIIPFQILLCQLNIKIQDQYNTLFMLMYLRSLKALVRGIQ